MNRARVLQLAAEVTNAMVVGATLDQAVKQLPTRHRIGVVAFSRYSRAGDLGNGIAWYPTLGSPRPGLRWPPASPRSAADLHGDRATGRRRYWPLPARSGTSW